MMMAAPSFMMMFLSLFNGLNLFSLPLGLPPGERDAAMQRVVADGCVVYSEWSGRADGVAGGKGLDGLVADAEILEFVGDVERALMTRVRAEVPQPELTPLVDEAPNSLKAVLASPGCLFVSVGSEAFPETDGTGNPGIVLQRLRAGLVLGLGEKAEGFEKHLLSVLKVAGVGSPTALDRVALPLPIPVGPLMLHREKGYVMVALGEPSLTSILDGINEKQPGISKDARIQGAFKEVAQERTGRWQWVDVKTLVTAADLAAGQSAMISQGAKILGLDGVESITSTQGLNAEGSILGRIHLHTDGKTERVLALATGRALKVSDFGHIPADADLVVAKSLNVQKIMDAVRTILKEAEPSVLEDMEQAITEVETELGISLEKDLFTAFGDVWTLYDAPSNGGLLVSSPVLAWEVKDPQQAYAIFTDLMKLVKAQMPGDIGQGRRRRGVFLHERKYLGHTIYFVNSVGDNDNPVAPAFCVTETHLLMALHPQTLKGHLRHIEAKGAMLSDNKSLAERIADREAIIYSSCDTVAVGRYLTPIMPYLGQIFVSELQTERIAIDSSTLPSARALLPYLNDSWMVISRNAHGLSIDSTNGLLLSGGESSLLLPVFMVGVRPTYQAGPPDVRFQEVEEAIR
ncbi:MAG: DUF3352 domain-containing protein [Planctomycetaceae bacterium]